MLYLIVKGKQEEKGLWRRWKQRYFALEESTLPHTGAKICYIHLADEIAAAGEKTEKALKCLIRYFIRRQVYMLECLYAERISNRFIRLFEERLPQKGILVTPYTGAAYFHQLYPEAVLLQLKSTDPVHTKAQILDAAFRDEKLESATLLSRYARQIGIVTLRTEQAGKAARRYYIDEGMTISVSDDLSRSAACDLLYIVDGGQWDVRALELKKGAKVLISPLAPADAYGDTPHGIREIRLFLPAQMSGQSAAQLRKEGICLNLVCAYLYERGICRRDHPIRELIWR